MATSTPPSGPSSRPALEEMGEREPLDVAGARRLVRRLAEVDEMLLAAQWAAVMASRARSRPDEPARWRRHSPAA